MTGRKKTDVDGIAYVSYECSVLSAEMGRYCTDRRCTSPRHEPLLPVDHIPRWKRRELRRKERERRRGTR